MYAVSWVLPPTRTCTAPARSAMMLMKFRKIGLMILLSQAFSDAYDGSKYDTYELEPTKHDRQLRK